MLSALRGKVTCRICIFLRRAVLFTCIFLFRAVTDMGPGCALMELISCLASSMQAIGPDGAALCSPASAHGLWIDAEITASEEDKHRQSCLR